MAAKILPGLFFILFSCSCLANSEIFIYHDPGKIITVSASTPQFIIQQPANPTTGYSWMINYYDKNLLKLVEIQYYPIQEKLMGVGGYMQWQFQATENALKQNRKTQIQLVYQRPWDPADHPRTVIFNIIILRP